MVSSLESPHTSKEIKLLSRQLSVARYSNDDRWPISRLLIDDAKPKEVEIIEIIFSRRREHVLSKNKRILQREFT